MNFATLTMVIKEFENLTSLPSMKCIAISKSRENRVDKIIESLRHLNKEERKNVGELIRKNQDRSHIPGDHILEHRIITTDDIPINIKQYRYTPAHREEINRQFQDLLDTDVVKPSTSILRYGLCRRNQTREETNVGD